MNTNVRFLIDRVNWKPVTNDDLFFKMESRKNMQDNCWMGNWNLIKIKEGENKLIPISTVGKRYAILHNEMLNGIINDFDGNGFNLKLNYNESVVNQDKRFELVYDIEGKGIDIGADDFDGALNPQILFVNSYDRTSKLGILFRVNRKVCANGLVIPVTISQLKLKHVKMNEDNKYLKKIIHTFLTNVLSNEVFDKVRDFVVKNKKKESEKTMSYSFFKGLSKKQLILTLAAIYTHSNISVVSKGMSFKNEENIIDFIEKIVKEKSNKRDKESFDFRKGIIEQWNTAISFVKEYNEVVNTHWMLYNLIIKVIQMVVLKHRRNEMALKIAKQFTV